MKGEREPGLTLEELLVFEVAPCRKHDVKQRDDGLAVEMASFELAPEKAHIEYPQHSIAADLFYPYLSDYEVAIRAILKQDLVLGREKFLIFSKSRGNTVIFPMVQNVWLNYNSVGFNMCW